MDNHEGHISLSSLNMAKYNGILHLTFNFYFSHNLETLGVHGPFKKYKTANEYLCSYLNLPISVHHLAETLILAYCKVFEVYSVGLLNESIFSNEEWLRSYMLTIHHVWKNQVLLHYIAKGEELIIV